MRLLIDLQSCQGAEPAQARFNLAEAMALVRLGAHHDIRLLLNARMNVGIESIRRAFDGLLPQDRITVFDLPARADADWSRRAAEQLREGAIAALRPDIVYVPGIFSALHADAVGSITSLSDRFPTVVSVGHVNVDAPADPDWHHQSATLRNASLLVHSQPGAPLRSLLGVDENQQTEIPLAFYEGANAAPKVEARTLQGILALVDKAVLETALSAFATVSAATRRDRPLLFVTSGVADDKDIRMQARRFGLAKDAIRFVRADEAAELYGSIEVVLSIGSGQDYAALAAMSCDAVVLASEDSSLAPLIKERHGLFAHVSPAAIAETLERVLNDSALREKLAGHARVVRGHATMSLRARQLLDEFETVSDRHLAAAPAALVRPVRRPRLAYVSPLPPARSGIADYSAELIPELARAYDIDLIVDQESVGDPYLNANFALRSVAWFEAHAHEFERIVYHFGNSPFHQHMFTLLAKYPGIVVLHDFYLGNIVHHLCEHGYLPGTFRPTLYQSHGFSALADLIRNGVHAAVWKYPANLAVLEQATGVIVHARYPQQLAQQWYGPAIVEKWATLPLLRGRRTPVTRTQARALLGVSPAEFVVCSFGMLGPTKRNTSLLAAWADSPLARDPNCRLVFVGANDGGAYGREFLRDLDKIRSAGKVELTGYVDAERYNHWLAASDVAVQLRSQSRGETSAAVLDCLLYALPTIVNAHGANAELPGDAIYALEDDFSHEQLVAALHELYSDAVRRTDLAACASAYIQAEHAPASVGSRYIETIEGFARQRGSGDLCNLLMRTIPEAAIRDFAQALGNNTRPTGLRQMLVDISALVQTDYKTGIQRVVRSVLSALIDSPPFGWRIEPVYTTGAGAPYRYARQFATTMLGIADWNLDDAPIDALPGDMFLGLDLATHWTRLNEGRLRQFRERGVQIYFVVYDILPILRPDVFPPAAEHDFKAWLPALARVADGLVCISRSVADDVHTYLDALPAPDRRPLKLGYFHLGADIAASTPSMGMPAEANALLASMAARPSFIIVGTLEPRKGHTQVLDAFELLWKRGVEVNLVIVGKRGWMVEPLAVRLDASNQRGNHLFWLENASDEMLLKLYEASDALIAASEGEGFGLPLIEAAQHGVPIIARALPVFREVAGDFAYYFEGSKGSDLANAVEAWLALQASGAAPASSGMPWLTWAAATTQLLDCVIGECWHSTIYATPSAPGSDVGALTTLPPRQLLVDVSTIARNDLRTGIERVVRAQLHALLVEPPAGIRVEPVYLNLEDGSWCYRYARQYADTLVAGAGGALDQSRVEVNRGDWLYCADYNPEAVQGAASQGLFSRWREEGVEISFLIHDLLPVLRPEFFPPGADGPHERWLAAVAANSDRVVCISRAVADEFMAWAGSREVFEVPEVLVLHHGADLASVPHDGLPDDAKSVLDGIAAAPAFLMVGTVEPRKGHLQALQAFEQLWQCDSPAQLVIVGKEGWSGLPDSERRTIPAIVERLRHHPELGRRLVWLEGISDEYLEAVYRAAACLLVPSEGEGFGLPLIEGARHGLPIIARDLPVFKEIAGDHAFYFAGNLPSSLAQVLQHWLALLEAGTAPTPVGMHWNSWRDNARQLVGLLRGETQG